MTDYNLSDNFKLSELLHSNTADAHNITQQYAPPAWVITNLEALCTHVLQPLRTRLGHVIIISSGYRCLELNAMVGGEPNSQHLSGQAADITAEGMTVQELYAFIKNSGIAVDQLIIEHDHAGNYWVHVSYNPELGDNQRGECLVGTLRPGGGTDVVSDGLCSFKMAGPRTPEGGLAAEQPSARWTDAKFAGEDIHKLWAKGHVVRLESLDFEQAMNVGLRGGFFEIEKPKINSLMRSGYLLPLGVLPIKDIS